MCCVHRWMYSVFLHKQAESERAPAPCAWSSRTEMNISVGSIKACRSSSQRTRLASLKLHLYSAEAFISCTYHKTAISANIAAASDYTVCSSPSLSLSLSPSLPRVTVVERPSDFTPYLKPLSFDTCKGCWDYGSGGCARALSSVCQWLNYKEWCTEAAEVSCFAAEPCNENFTSKDERGANEQLVWFWILLFIGFHINPALNNKHQQKEKKVDFFARWPLRTRVLITKTNQYGCCL